MLSSFLHSFVDSSRGGVPFRPTPLPILGLSEGDKQCIRDRSSIMARHFFADKSEDFINAQVWNFNGFTSFYQVFQNFVGDFLHPSSEMAFCGPSQVPMSLIFWCMSNYLGLRA